MFTIAHLTSPSLTSSISSTTDLSCKSVGTVLSVPSNTGGWRWALSVNCRYLTRLSWPKRTKSRLFGLSLNLRKNIFLLNRVEQIKNFYSIFIVFFIIFNALQKYSLLLVNFERKWDCNHYAPTWANPHVTWQVRTEKQVTAGLRRKIVAGQMVCFCVSFAENVN